MSARDSGWWNDFFPEFRQFLGKIPQRVTHAQVRYFVKKLGLKPGMKFLDCPCGIGRIALPMAKMGIRVTGVDIMQSYLDEFSEKAHRAGIKVDLVRADMRRINFDSQFDAAGNLWTSFGYFEEESAHLLVLKKIYKALKPGGKFLLHVLNRDWIIVNYASTGTESVGGVEVFEKRWFDYSKSINYDEWHFQKDGVEKTFNTNIRLYSFHELLAMFKKTGFIDIEGYGSIKDDPISRDSREMFIIGTRPTANTQRLRR